MKSWQKQALHNLLAKGFAVFRWFITCLLVMGLTSCTEKAVSQDVSVSNKEKTQLVSKQFSEVSPPATIQDLESVLDIYQPQVSIITPKPDEVLQENRVTVQLQVKDLPIFKDPELKLGPHLEVILDNQPEKAIYDLNQPLVLSDLSPGTHTLRVFASRPWEESFKNEGAFAQTTFHVFAKTDDNNPDPSLPLLTYNRPRGNYGAEPILLDFYLTNAPLHLVSEEDSQDGISNWRIRCTINDESFVFDKWQAIYLKGFKPGNNWVKLEFLDNQGNPVKNAFNTTVAVLNYEPKGKDTLSKIVRGELKADEVRSIVDPNYIVKKQPAEPAPNVTPEVKITPQVKPKLEKPEPTPAVTPEVKITPQVEPKPEKPEPAPTVTPEVKITPQVEPKLEKPEPAPTVTPEVKITPQVEPKIEKQPIPEIKEAETSQTRPERPKPEVPKVVPSPRLVPNVTPETRPEVTPTPKIESLDQVDSRTEKQN